MVTAVVFYFLGSYIDCSLVCPFCVASYCVLVPQLYLGSGFELVKACWSIPTQCRLSICDSESFLDPEDLLVFADGVLAKCILGEHIVRA